MSKKNYTKINLVNKVNGQIGLSKNYSSKIIDNFFETFIAEVIKKNIIKISSFGTFEVIEKKERIGRNPKTKTSARIAARKVLKFKPSSLLKSKINTQ